MCLITVQTWSSSWYQLTGEVPAVDNETFTLFARKKEELNRESDFAFFREINRQPYGCARNIEWWKTAGYLNNMKCSAYLSIWCLTTPKHLSLDTFFQCCSWFLIFYDFFFIPRFFSVFVTSQFLLLHFTKKNVFNPFKVFFMIEEKTQQNIFNFFFWIKINLKIKLVMMMSWNKSLILKGLQWTNVRSLKRTKLIWNSLVGIALNKVTNSLFSSLAVFFRLTRTKNKREKKWKNICAMLEW